MLRFTSVALASGLFAVAAPCPSAAAGAGTAVGEFLLEAGEHNLPRLIDRAAEFLGRNHLYSEDDLGHAGHLEVRLQNRLVLDRRGCEALVSELAFAKGIAMLPLDAERGVYQWIHMRGSLSPKLNECYESLSPDEVMARRSTYVPVLTHVPLTHINPTAATNQLRPFFAAGAGQPPILTVGAAARSIVLLGLAPRVASAIELLRQTDVGPEVETGRGVHAAGIDQEEIEKRFEALERRVKALEPKSGE
ncbi:MAG: hypothetical protein AAF628_12995 [Planctomycetota bacterium]